MSYVSGLLYEYYHICKRKTWYCANGISMESGNDNVQIGKLIDENACSRERKHILVDDNANIDFMRDNTVYEIKKSSAQKDAAIAQIKYYLYVLDQKGVEADGELRIPDEKLAEDVSLSEDDKTEVAENIRLIEELVSAETAPKLINSRICKKCAFYELCYI